LDDDIELFKEDLPPEALRQGQFDATNGDDELLSTACTLLLIPYALFVFPRAAEKEGDGTSKKMSSSGRAKEHRGGSRKSAGGGSHARRAHDEEEESGDEDEDEEESGEEDEEEEEEEYEDATQRNKSHKKNVADSPTGNADEIVYCVCRQPSYGDMVGCDNKTCPYEW
jgi:hypothetical protein